LENYEKTYKYLKENLKEEIPEEEEYPLCLADKFEARKRK